MEVLLIVQFIFVKYINNPTVIGEKKVTYHGPCVFLISQDFHGLVCFIIQLNNLYAVEPFLKLDSHMVDK